MLFLAYRESGLAVVEIAPPQREGVAARNGEGRVVHVACCRRRRLRLAGDECSRHRLHAWVVA